MPSIVGTTGGRQAAVSGGSIEAALPSTIVPVLSMEVLFQALAKLRFMQFARTKQDLRRTKGDTIRMHRYAPIKKGKKLTEGVHIQPKTMEATTQDIQVDEWGNAINLTQFLEATSIYDQYMLGVQLLADDYALVTEQDLMLTLNSIPSVYFANGKANRAALTNGDTMGPDTIRSAVTVLKNKNVPTINFTDPLTGAIEQVYVCFVNPHQTEYMRKSQEWREAVRYSTARRIFLGEVGMFEKVIFIEGTMQPIIQNDAVTGGEGHMLLASGEDLSDSTVYDDPVPADLSPHATLNVHRAFLIGDYTYGFAEALPVEVREDPPKDLGREHMFGWYAIQGSDLINSDHGLIIETT